MSYGNKHETPEEMAEDLSYIQVPFDVHLNEGNKEFIPTLIAAAIPKFETYAQKKFGKTLSELLIDERPKFHCQVIYYEGGEGILEILLTNQTTVEYIEEETE